MASWRRVISNSTTRPGTRFFKDIKMENIINVTIPHIGEQIFENIDTKALVRFLSVSETWRDLAENVLLKRWKGKLFKACVEGETEIVKLLLEHSQIGDPEMNATDERGCTAFLFLVARCYGYNDVAELLLNYDDKKDHGLDKETMDFAQTSPSRLPWLAVVVTGYMYTVELLMNHQHNYWKGIALHSRRNDSMNVFKFACTFGHKDIVQLLLEHPKTRSNIDINAKDCYGRTACMLACSNGNADVVEYLLGLSTIDLNDRDNYGMTALMLACSHGRADVVKILLRRLGRHNDLNVRDDRGWTAFTMACVYGDKDIVQMVFRHPQVTDVIIAENAEVSREIREYVMDLDHYASSNEKWKREVFVNVLCEKLMDVIVKQEAKKINNLKREPTCENCFEKGHTSTKCTELMEII